MYALVWECNFVPVVIDLITIYVLVDYLVAVKLIQQKGKVFSVYCIDCSQIWGKPGVNSGAPEG